jgi:hypothetical protein
MPTMPTTTTTAPELVTLKGGFAVTLDALRLLWHLEDAGLHVRLDDAGGLVVGPRSRITLADDALIREHKAELIALVRYVEVM